ncbi:unnamed protein product [Brassica oleracea]
MTLSSVLHQFPICSPIRKKKLRISCIHTRINALNGNLLCSVFIYYSFRLVESSFVGYKMGILILDI